MAAIFGSVTLWSAATRRAEPLRKRVIYGRNFMTGMLFMHWMQPRPAGYRAPRAQSGSIRSFQQSSPCATEPGGGVQLDRHRHETRRAPGALPFFVVAARCQFERRE